MVCSSLPGKQTVGILLQQDVAEDMSFVSSRVEHVLFVVLLSGFIGISSM